jgi:hypothetical protein
MSDGRGRRAACPTAAGVGAIEDFFDTSTWLIALAGAVLAPFAYELTTSTRDGGENSRRAIRLWVGRAGGESETLDRNR